MILRTGAQSRQDDRVQSVLSVVGAAPAGLACAIVLARADQSVVVHEQRDRVGARLQSDFQGLANWSLNENALLEFARSGIAPSLDFHAVSHEVAFDEWGARYAIETARPLYYVVRAANEDAPGGGSKNLPLVASKVH